MPRNRTVFGIIVERVGLRKGWQAVDFILTWALCEVELGRPPANVEELAEWWNDGRHGKSDLVSVPTLYRRQQAFRQAFEPWSIETPHGLFAVMGIKPEEFSVDSIGRAEIA